MRAILLAVSMSSFIITGCATTYESACHELASEQRSEINRRTKAVKKGTFERHFILLETGNEIASKCRSHFIDSDVFEGLPDSASSLCYLQSSGGDKYCTIYLIDGIVVKKQVY